LGKKIGEIIKVRNYANIVGIGIGINKNWNDVMEWCVNGFVKGLIKESRKWVGYGLFKSNLEDKKSFIMS